MARYIRAMKCVYTFAILGAILSLGGNAQDSPVAGDKCRTEDDQEGECMHLRPCKPYMQMLKSRHLDKESVKFIRRSRCGGLGSSLVCCPSSGIAMLTDRKKRRDLASHPNWKLLNSDICGDVYETKILNGEVAHGSMLALLQYLTNNRTEFLCDGALINERYVLTAAHCVQPFGKIRKLISVRLGEKRIGTDPDCEETMQGAHCNGPVQDINVEEIIPHPQYTNSRKTPFMHNIALIRLERPATFNADTVVPICLPDGSELANAYENAHLKVAAWQNLERNSLGYVWVGSGVQSISNAACSKIYEKYFTLGEDHICVEGLRACEGDTGGVLMNFGSTSTAKYRKWIALGVGPFGPRTCTNSLPEVFTRVAPYMEWILDTLKP